MELGLQNKNALVCGSTQGIGRATAISLAKEGANITLMARNEKALKEALYDLPQLVLDGLLQMKLFSKKICHRN